MEDALIQRIPPNSKEAEQSVIGSMIMDAEAISIASELLTAEDFYNKSYGLIFSAMVELYFEGKAVDIVTLSERLKEKNITIRMASPKLVMEEAPESYKDVEDVCNTCNLIKLVLMIRSRSWYF